MCWLDDDAEKTQCPVDDPVPNADGDSGDNGATKTTDLHTGKEFITNHQDNGGDDQCNDGTEPSAPHGDAEKTQQPYEDSGNDGDDQSRPDRTHKAINRETKVELADDPDDKGGDYEYNNE